METNPKGERRCAVGVGPNGEPIFEQFVRLAWAEAGHAVLTTALDGCVEALKLLLGDFKHLRETYEPDAMMLHRPSIEAARAALEQAKKARG